MSVYAVVLRTVKENAGLTAAQIQAKIGLGAEDSVDNVLDQATRNGTVTKSGSGPSATYTSTAEQDHI